MKQFIKKRGAILALAALVSCATILGMAQTARAATITFNYTNTVYTFSNLQGADALVLVLTFDGEPGGASGRVYGYQDKEGHHGGFISDPTGLSNNLYPYTAALDGYLCSGSDDFFRTATSSASCVKVISWTQDATGLTSQDAPDFDLGKTRIDSVTPAGASQNATSTSFTFGATGYLNSADLTPPSFFNNNYDNLHIAWKENQIASCNGVDVIQAFDCSAAFSGGQQGPTGSYDYPLVASGAFSFSTTTNIQDQGDYTLTVSIDKPGGQFLGFSFWNDSIVSTTTMFTVASTTGFNDLQRAFGEAVRALGTATSTPVDLSVCNPLSGKFELNLCFSGLFQPQGNDMQNLVNNLQNGAFSRAPWGYAYRFITIINGLSTTTATSSLPTYTATIVMGPGDNSNTSTSTLSFDPGDMIAGGANLLGTINDTVNGKSLRDVMEPFVQLTLALAVIFYIVNDILGMSHIGGGGRRYERPQQTPQQK